MQLFGNSFVPPDHFFELFHWDCVDNIPGLPPRLPPTVVVNPGDWNRKDIAAFFTVARRRDRDVSKIGSSPLMKHYIDWYFLNLFCQNSNWLLCRWWELSQQLHKRDSRSEEAEEGQDCLHWLPAPDPGEKLREAEVSVSPGQTGAGSQAEPVRHSGQDLVPEQKVKFWS